MLLNKEKNFISAVVYVYNQETQIYRFLELVNETLRNSFEKYEIICVNDASTDGSIKERTKCLRHSQLPCPSLMRGFGVFLCHFLL